jgi:hypothetical protein
MQEDMVNLKAIQDKMEFLSRQGIIDERGNPIKKN